jgi:heptosyltransferase-2
MSLPALHAAKPDAVVLPRWLEPLAQLAGFKTIPIDTVWRGARELRRHTFKRGVLLTPSFSSALMFKLGGVPNVRGTNTDRRGFLLKHPMDRTILAHNHRATAYMILATGDVPNRTPVPTLHVQCTPQGNTIGIVPGSNAPARTWPAERFAALAKELSKHTHVMVFGSAQEKELTRAVASDVAEDRGGKTNLVELANALAQCRVVIGNDTGTMHLAAAVGTRTVSLWGAGNPTETGPPEGHEIIRHTELPCLECVRNRCPRRGKGYILPEAYNECLHLITVDQVIERYTSR